MSNTQEATFPEGHAAVYVRSVPPRKQWFLYLGALYVGIVALVYLPSFGAYFQADDFELINKVARFGPFGLWTTSHDHLGFLRPLISLSLFLNYRLWGNKAFGYHLTNLIAHLLNGFLVAGIAKCLLTDLYMSETRKRGIATLAGALFLLLPSHVEAVAWVSGRTDVLSACFALLSTLAYLLSRQRAQKSLLVVSVIAYALGLASKESVLTLPLVFVAYELICARRSGPGRRAFPPLLAYLVVLLAYLFWRHAALGSFVAGYPRQYQHLSVRHVVYSLLMYVLFGFAPFPALRSWGIAVSYVVLVALGAVALKKRAFAPPTRLALAAFLVLLAPVATFAIGPDGQGERCVYLPSAFSMIALAFLFSQIFFRKYLMLVTACCVVAFGAQTVQASLLWRHASRICQAIVDSLPPTERQPATILMAPDSYQSAFIFRNGLQDALLLRYGTQARSVWQVASVGAKAGQDAFEVEKKGDAYIIRPSAGNRSDRSPIDFSLEAGDFFEVMPTPGTAMSLHLKYARTGAILADSITIRLKGARQNDAVAYYSKGKLIWLRK